MYIFLDLETTSFSKLAAI